MRSFDVIDTSSDELSEAIIGHILKPKSNYDISENAIHVSCVEHDKLKKNNLSAVSEYLLKVTGIYHLKSEDMPYAQVNVDALAKNSTETSMGRLILSEPPILELDSLEDLLSIGDFSKLGKFDIPNKE